MQARVLFIPRMAHFLRLLLDFSIKLWDVEEGAEKLTLEGHTAAVYSIQVELFGVVYGSNMSLL